MGDKFSEPTSSEVFCASFILTEAMQSPVGKPKLAGVAWKLWVPSGDRERVSERTDSRAGHILFNAEVWR